MRWLKKHFGRADYTADQEKIAALHLALKGLRGVVMLAAGEKILDHTIYIRIPDQFAAGFPDYEPAEAPTESRVSGLYGDQDDLNQYIKIKR
jgi:hypothetical protein